MKNAIEIGKAAEYLVCADLILRGIRCFPTDQGLPYDLMAEHDGRLFRIQVKASLTPRNVNASGRNERVAYSWSVRRRGKNGKGTPLTEKDCDVLALVAVDIKVIAYIPIAAAAGTIQLIPPGAEHKTKARHGWGWSRSIDQFPFSDILKADLSLYAPRVITHCPKGHEYTVENTIVSRGRRHCRKCHNAKSVVRVRKWRERNAA